MKIKVELQITPFLGEICQGNGKVGLSTVSYQLLAQHLFIIDHRFN